ncbi:hypothetical protein P154DRAFT_223703 [Amniculicola lignicola CBS 123094]|uniref:F-box domain-containing protein n=1 Tax=Amniculicola lignicola CBS 123094 TaxID=1392246 RepID=A0A6A5WY36_9PLEO|nr:hypothetical protein P154DRAFT_223703 [Amniculicola lignicola CBS 123094]
MARDVDLTLRGNQARLFLRTILDKPVLAGKVKSMKLDLPSALDDDIMIADRKMIFNRWQQPRVNSDEFVREIQPILQLKQLKFLELDMSERSRQTLPSGGVGDLPKGEKESSLGTLIINGWCSPYDPACLLSRFKALKILTYRAYQKRWMRGHLSLSQHRDWVETWEALRHLKDSLRTLHLDFTVLHPVSHCFTPVGLKEFSSLVVFEVTGRFIPLPGAMDHIRRVHSVD